MTNVLHIPSRFSNASSCDVYAVSFLASMNPDCDIISLDCVIAAIYLCLMAGGSADVRRNPGRNAMLLLGHFGLLMMQS